MELIAACDSIRNSNRFPNNRRRLFREIGETVFEAFKGNRFSLPQRDEGELEVIKMGKVQTETSLCGFNYGRGIPRRFCSLFYRHN